MFSVENLLAQPSIQPSQNNLATYFSKTSEDGDGINDKKNVSKVSISEIFQSKSLPNHFETKLSSDVPTPYVKQSKCTIASPAEASIYQHIGILPGVSDSPTFATAYFWLMNANNGGAKILPSASSNCLNFDLLQSSTGQSHRQYPSFLTKPVKIEPLQPNLTIGTFSQFLQGNIRACSSIDDNVWGDHKANETSEALLGCPTLLGSTKCSPTNSSGNSSLSISASSKTGTKYQQQEHSTNSANISKRHHQVGPQRRVKSLPYGILFC